VDWHPSGTAIAVNLNLRDEVLFLRVARAEDGHATLQGRGGPCASPGTRSSAASRRMTGNDGWRFKNRA
jgi:hypothetical protein